MEQAEEPIIYTDDEQQEALVFLDASDDFPFYDCLDYLDSTNPNPNHLSSSPRSAQSQSHGLRRRRSLNTPQSPTLCSDSLEPATSHVVEQPQNKHHHQQQHNDTSTLTFDENIPLLDTQAQYHNTTNNLNNAGSGSHLVYVAEFLVNAIVYQFHLLISILTFPFWVLYYTFIFAFNPFIILTFIKSFLISNLNKLFHIFKPYVNEWLNEHKPWFNFALRCGWGLFWSLYVCIVLISLLISSFLIGGLIMRYYVVEEPFQLKQSLNFDYTSSKPVAYVPVIVCPNDNNDGNEVGNDIAGSVLRVITPKHKLQTTVTMVLPESDYNRNLGIFQVKVEFISENGKSLGTFRHPCMLEFKSQPLRLLLTFFKIIPLVAGYLSETQTLKLTFRGYTEGVIPTACLKITMEQRAEFRPSAGIPEVYDAFVHVESELPIFRRILWYWRRTIFVWLSMTVFAMELLFALICCTPAIIPRTRSSSNVTSSNPPLTTPPVQS